MTDEKQTIEEIVQDIAYSCVDMAYNVCGDVTCCGCLGKSLHDLGYRKLPENAVVLTKEEYTALINEFNALQHKYDDICDRYRLCKDENKTIKQHAVMVRKETAMEISERVKERIYLCENISQDTDDCLCEDIDEIVKEITEGKK